MATPLGHIAALFRYPVKSMRGEQLDTAAIGWNGITGDRRLAIRRLDDRGGFPWLTASRLPELLLYSPCNPDGANDGHIPTHVRTPDGNTMPLLGDDFAAEISRRHGAPVQVMHLNQGIFDEACISVITTDTIEEVGRLSATEPDRRRFRPNIVIRLGNPRPFLEDAWLGHTLRLGAPDGPVVSVTLPDVRCSMISLDPDSARPQPQVLKSVVQANQNHAGVYCNVTRTGAVSVGQPVFLRDA